MCSDNETLHCSLALKVKTRRKYLAGWMHHRYTGRQSLPSDTYRTDITQLPPLRSSDRGTLEYPVMRSLTAREDVEWGTATHRTAQHRAGCRT